ncbi:TRAP transporter large permease [Pseudohoeflea coraliihabitans]|uniref:TRAP transporter large permease protein n=1 Tax=Pseudohoeflea coraliihabitans TaxID=2860393 RepID=A0ABS6WN21_9HYPH|nr:TRAP transporter large permease [Pseudohoeflea sp. DP4N28-3]MBW3097190.1 TRAP transporter large permease [Pseudohoeflea sp. DP4N28-3]
MTLFLLGFFILLILGMPIVFALAVPVMLYLLFTGHPPLTALAQQMYTAADSFPLLAIPFFLLAGELMTRANLTNAIVNFSQASIGWIRGGLAHANVLASMLFAGISGSAIADSVAIGKVMIPAMEKAGFDRRDAAAITAASSVIGPIIPPSIPMIVLGSTVGISISGLFAGGLVPGVMIGAGLMLASFWANRNNSAVASTRFSIRVMIITFIHAIIPLTLPVILIGGILGGVFTPTEAGAVAVVYALVIGLFVYRSLSASQLWEAMLETVKGTCMIMLIVAAANPFSWILSVNQMPQTVAAFLVGISDNPIVVLLMINLMLLIAGMFLETTANILILGPILIPAGAAVGLDPIQLGVVMVINLVIGLITPPVGLCLFSTAAVAEIHFGQLIRRIWPYLIVELVVLILISVFPVFTLLVPSWLGFI